MDSKAAASQEARLAALLARHDDRLAAGDAPAELPPGETPEDLRLRLEDDLACLQVLQQLRPQAQQLAPPAPANPPDLGSRYQVLRLHATGGIGRVWLARDAELSRCVALKDLRPEKARQAALRARFLREAQITGQLQHPGIVPVYEVLSRPTSADPAAPAEGEEGTEPFYTMRFIKGRTLTAAIGEYHRRRAAGAAGVLDLVGLLNAFVSACNTVAYAHSRGVLHRDLKGQNVVVGDFGEVVVLDWGFAKMLRRAAADDEGELAPVFPLPDEAAAVDQSLLGQVMGTPAYMAPEQATGRLGLVDERTDVYGLGAILYEILTGRPPYVGADSAEVLRQVRAGAPPRPGVVRAGVPRPLEAVCRRALARDPADRYASVVELARDVQNWLADEPVAAYPESAVARLGRWARRHKPAVAGAVVLIMTALAAGVAGTALVGRERAQTAEVRAGAARQQVVMAARAREELEAHVYFQRIALAEREVSAGNIRRAIQYLAACPAERRGWEWDCLQRLCRTDALTLRGHKAAVATVAFSPDGRWLVSAGHDRTIRVWDAATGEPSRTLPGHTGAVYALAFSPDGRRLASGSWDRTVKLWDLGTGRELLSLGPHAGDVYRLAFSPDGRTVASSTAGNSLYLWDAGTGKLLLSRQEEHSFFGLAFSPTQDGVLATSHLRSVKLWNYRTGEVIATLEGHGNLIKALAFSPNGRFLASGDGDVLQEDAGEVRVWDLADRRRLFKLVGHTDPIYSLAFTPDGRYLASASEDRTVKLWELTTGQEVLTLRGHTDTVRSVAFSPDGYRLASASADTTVRVLDATPWCVGEEQPGAGALILPGGGGRVIGVTYSPDGRHIASGSEDPAIKVWNAATGDVACSVAVPSGIFAVAYSPDGKYLASGHNDGSVRLFDAAGGQEVHCFLEPQLGPVKSVAFSPDGRRLAAGGWWRPVQVWDVASRRKLFTLTRHTQPVLCVAFGPTGRYLASAGYDETVIVWDARTGEPVHTLRGHAGRIESLAFSPDGQRLASASHDGVMTLWDTSTWTVARTLRAHAAGVNSVAFSPDSRRLASASDDWTVRIWDVKTGEELQTLRGHSDRVHSVTFSPDGRHLVSGSYDRSVRIWDVPGS